MSRRSRAPRPPWAVDPSALTLVVTWRVSGDTSIERAVAHSQDWADGLLGTPAPEPVSVEAIPANSRLPLRKWARS